MTRPQVTALVTLRLFIGWHFLYEGLAKLVNPYWTSAEYLDQRGCVAGDDGAAAGDRFERG